MTGFERPYISLPDIVSGHARWNPDGLALICGSHRLTWRALDERINRLANALLAGGLARGDKVGALMGNRVEMVEAILGAVKAGGVIVPLSPLVTGAALAGIINDADARFLLVSAPLHEAVAPIGSDLSAIAEDGFILAGAEAEGWTPYEAWLATAPARDPGERSDLDDDFNIIYSSGTTGTPKGIVHTHCARMQFAQLLAIEFRFDATAVALLATPLYSNGTWMMLLPALTLGCAVVIMEKFDPRGFLSTVAAERATHTFLVPPQFTAILAVSDLADVDLSSLRILVSAGAPLETGTKERIIATLGPKLFELYGLTEGIATTLKPEVVLRKLASVGTPAAGGDIRIVDEGGRELPRGEAGEIAGYGPAMMRGYYERPDATAGAIWRDERGRTYLRTGDIGRLDEDGYLTILDRKKDMIISGGFNVFPSDIEEVLRRHPAVADVAVIGIPSERWGETPLALVVLRPGSAATPEELAAWCNERVARHQRVGAVELREAIPRVPPLGKVAKRELRAPYWEGRRA